MCSIYLSNYHICNNSYHNYDCSKHHACGLIHVTQYYVGQYCVCDQYHAYDYIYNSHHICNYIQYIIKFS